VAGGRLDIEKIVSDDVQTVLYYDWITPPKF